MEQTTTDNLTMHSDKELVQTINNAIRLQIKSHGNVTTANIGSLSKLIVSSIQGIVHNAMVSYMNQQIDKQKYIVIEKSEYEKLKGRDLLKSIKFLSDRLKEIDPNFNKVSQ
jgi:hypothetical protein